MLHINDLTYRIEGRALIENATVAIPEGHKVGLVGRNGTGKTTLLRIISGQLHADDGDIRLPKGHRIGWVEQEAPGDDRSLLDTVLAADGERSALLDEAESATDPHRIAEIQHRLVDIDAHSAPARAASILAGLGFPTEDQARPCKDFSGGWRMRVALAGVLFARPDLLLLDEPTNYLDLEGTLWLESYLRTYPYTVLLVSHDRDLLNTCVGSILHLENLNLTLYKGGYDTFERVRRERQAQQLSLKAKQDDQRRHMQAFVDRFRAKATKARQAQSRLKALEKMKPIAAMVEAQVAPFHLTNPEKHLAPPIMRLDSAGVGYEPGKPILRNISARIDMDDRIALLGANGNGKSTLAKLLSGRLSPCEGRLLKSKKLTFGYFAQHQLDEMNEAETPFEALQRRMEGATQAQIRARLGQFGFDKARADTKIGKLSGGEKARLLLHLCTHDGPHVLILDEPTNHLDVDSREALIRALNDYTGCVILISHDRHLLEACVDRLWLVANGTVEMFEGDLSDYRMYLLEKANTRPKRDPKGESKGDTKKSARQDAAAKRHALAPLKKRMTDLERALEKLHAQQEQIDAALADPDLYTRDPQKAAALNKQRTDLAQDINNAEHDWLEASEEYEKAQGDH